MRTALAVVLLSALVRAGVDRYAGRADPLGGYPDVAASLDSAAGRLQQEGERRALPLAPNERLDANRASAVELDRLPGVGPSLAAAWVSLREAEGGFRNASDLEAVPGIGPATARRLAPLLQFSPRASMLERREETSRSRRDGAATASSRTVDLNAADSAALMRLPGIGPALAGRILARRRESPFGSIGELVEVPGIGPATLERLRDRLVAGRRRR